MDYEKLKQKIKHWYNGYSWDGVNTVYNPFSILNFFADGQFKNYWFSTGTPTYLIEKFKQSKFQISDIKSFNVTDVFFDSYELEKFDFRSLLFQTGYLTITKFNIQEMEYTLGYPNNEVKNAFLVNIAAIYIEQEPGDIGYLNNKLKQAIDVGDIDRFVSIIKSIIAKIPYQLHIKKEAYYHTVFYLIMELMGIDIDMEINTSIGRIDGVIELENNIYILEFKYLAENKNAAELLNVAISQIKTKKYFDPYLLKDKSINYLAIVVNKEIVEYKIETDQHFSPHIFNSCMFDVYKTTP